MDFDELLTRYSLKRKCSIFSENRIKKILLNNLFKKIKMKLIEIFYWGNKLHFLPKLRNGIIILNFQFNCKFTLIIITIN